VSEQLLHDLNSAFKCGPVQWSAAMSASAIGDCSSRKEDAHHLAIAFHGGKVQGRQSAEEREFRMRTMCQQGNGGFVTASEHGPVQRGQASAGPRVAIGTVLAKQLHQLSMIMHRRFVESRQTCNEWQLTWVPGLSRVRLHIQEQRISSQ